MSSTGLNPVTLTAHVVAMPDHSDEVLEHHWCQISERVQRPNGCQVLKLSSSEIDMLGHRGEQYFKQKASLLMNGNAEFYVDGHNCDRFYLGIGDNLVRHFALTIQVSHGSRFPVLLPAPAPSVTNNPTHQPAIDPSSSSLQPQMPSHEFNYKPPPQAPQYPASPFEQSNMMPPRFPAIVDSINYQSNKCTTAASSNLGIPKALGNKETHQENQNEDNQQDNDKKNGKEPHVKRPSNPWILYRSSQHHIVARSQPKGTPNGDISKIISSQWKSMSKEEKKPWFDLFQTQKAEHKRLHPDYVFHPHGKNPTNKKAKTSSPGVGGVENTGSSRNGAKQPLSNGSVTQQDFTGQAFTQGGFATQYFAPRHIINEWEANTPNVGRSPFLPQMNNNMFLPESNNTSTGNILSLPGSNNTGANNNFFLPEQNNTSTGNILSLPESNNTGANNNMFLPEPDNTSTGNILSLPGSNNTVANNNFFLPEQNNTSTGNILSPPESNNTGTYNNFFLPEPDNASADSSLYSPELDNTNANNSLSLPELDNASADSSLSLPELDNASGATSLYSPEQDNTNADNSLSLPELDNASGAGSLSLPELDNNHADNGLPLLENELSLDNILGNDISYEQFDMGLWELNELKWQSP
ncbi:hypothetical protein F4825DRAFT_449133 [Nemania diffusa]|nr:hypothetical protein F4825DRAFT_449133 [Nemania diffusa]